MGLVAAARAGDPLAHSSAAMGLLLGAVAGAVIGALLVAGTIASGGTLLVAVAVVGGGLAAGAGLGELIGSLSSFNTFAGVLVPLPMANVFVNGKTSMVAHLGAGMCKDHGSMVIAQGSGNVYVNGQPMARKGDKLTCSAFISKGSGDVFVGGGTVDTDIIDPEVPEWVHTTLLAIGIASSIVLTGGLLTLVGLAGGALGGHFGAAVGRGIGGEGSDAEKLGMLIGSIFGGLLGYKGVQLRMPKSRLLRTVDQRLRLPKRWTSRPLAMRTCRKDPIDVVSGEMIMQQQDLLLPGTLALELKRTHISGYRSGKLFGPAWASTWDQRLEMDGEVVRYYSADGLTIELALPDPESASLPDRVHNVALSRWNDCFLLGLSGGQTLCFEPQSESAARLSAIIAPSGQSIRLLYDEKGGLCEAAHSGGYRLQVQCVEGRITAVGLNTPLKTAEDDQQSKEDAAHLLLRYRYHESGHESGQLQAVVNSSGLPLVFGYDEAGRVSRWQDRRGTWCSYEYDASGRCVRTVGVNGTLEGTFNYDPEQRITVLCEADGRRSTFHYNAWQQIMREVDALGGVKEYAWDEFDRKTLEVDPLGRVTRYEYDDNGRLVCLTRPDDSSIGYAYDERGLCTGVTDMLGRCWARKFDARGFLVEATLPTGQKVTYENDEHGSCKRLTDPNGHSRTFEFDERGLLIRASDYLGNLTHYERDAFGRLARCTDAEGHTRQYAHTLEGHLAELIGPDGARQTWSYDAEGVVASHTDSLGRTTNYQTGWFDQASGEVRADGSRFQWQRNTELQVTTVTDALGKQWRYELDPLGRVTAETDSNGRRICYAYDAAGQCTAETNALGQVTRYEYDEMGRVTLQASVDGTSRFEYDKAGNLVGGHNEDADVRFERDGQGRVIKETINGLAVHSTYDELGRRVCRALGGSDTVPRGSSRERSDGGELVGALDDDRSLFESTWQFDANGMPVGLQLPGDGLFSFTHDALGREAARDWEVRGAKLRQVKSYDAGGRLVRHNVTADEGGTRRQQRPVQQRAWKYDGAGRTRVQADLSFGSTRYELDQGDRVTAASGDTGQEHYAYDLAGNLIEAVRKKAWLGKSRASRSPNGARTYVGSQLQTAGEIRYDYDAQGRVVQRREARGRVWHYHWTARDRLRSIVTPEGEVWRYGYDAFGRRVRKERVEEPRNKGPRNKPAATERVAEHVTFLWDGDLLAQETAVKRQFAKDGAEQIDKRQTRTTTWEYAPDTFVPLTQTVEKRQKGASTRECYAVVTDAIGTPRELVSSDGRIAWQARTTLWGEVDAVRGSGGACPIGFQGQYRDDESGLAYNRHRYYDPSTGRYQSSDPLQLDGGWVPHGYVHNPIERVDPLGLLACEPFNPPPQSERFKNLGPEDQVYRVIGPISPKKFASLPRGEYNFVVTENNKLLIGVTKRSNGKHVMTGTEENPIWRNSHIDLSKGAEYVRAAGIFEVFEQPGVIIEWRNHSGHYEPTTVTQALVEYMFKWHGLKLAPGSFNPVRPYR